MLLETMTQAFRQPMTTDFATTFPSRIPTITEPLGSATRWVIDNGSYPIGQSGQNSVIILPYGVGADNATFLLRLYGWRVLPWRTFGNVNQWIPILLAQLTCTLDAGSPGVATTEVGSTKYFVDTLSLTYGNANVSIDVNTIASTGLIAHFQASIKGFQKLECTFDTNSSATGMNALVATA